MSTFGIGLYGENLYGEGESPNGIQATTMVGSITATLTNAVALGGVQATCAVGVFSNAGVPGQRTFFIASTTQKVIPPGIQMYPTSETINLESTPYIIGSSQFYTVGEVIWDGEVKVEGVDWEFVNPFTHIIKILNLPSMGLYGKGRYGLGYYSASDAIGTPITLVYMKWNIQVSSGFEVTSYPVPFAFSNTKIIAEEVPPLGQYFTVKFVANRLANNPQTLFSLFPLMVDDMLADHTSYDGSKGFQTYRPNCYQVLDTTSMQVFEWTGSTWVSISDVANGTAFYVKSLRAVYQNNDGVAVLKYTAGDGLSGDYPEVLTYPAFGEGIGKNLIVDGFSANARTQYPAAYQVCSTPGTYDPACEDEGFDEDFDFSFG